ncbi:phosphatidylserine synthase [Bernardetia litoralis DSM 6794]|uniref:Phosphatidylserine synthase n=1 Tax=Bernardetia litoralis (strain ATCC 23117 / DSM 6794 / NBRC 15988 / NCIMB 1366 / Fx l1 / Sio-4) TaxID=880071 RepID=I4AKE4_BERLS|nr:CDP-alcohol phosphatidyltransferase family protein [Bernardetia litoralis]AFM04429.1 phosphatidylserine synthase [Bernardetia litoralis DSM 6794]
MLEQEKNLIINKQKTIRMKKHIPNFLTCCNLFFGCIGIIFSFNKNLEFAAYCIGIAAIFDFLDGFVARMLKVSSPIGKELDSLADCVTFGVLPAFIMYQLMISASLEKVTQNLVEGQIPTAMDSYLPYIALLIAVFSALRLAKFNVDTRQSDSFIGVPTPANAILIGSIPLILLQNSTYSSVILNPILLVILTIVMSLLLVAELPLFALKFKSFAFKGNEIRYIFILSSILLLAFLQFLGVPLIILLYVLLSVVSNMVSVKVSDEDNLIEKK